MILLAYTIFTITLVLQRKEVARGLALGLASLTIPAVPLGVLQLHRRQHRPGRGPVLRGARDPAVPGAAPARGPGLLRPALTRPADSGRGRGPGAILALLHVRPPVHARRPGARRASRRQPRRRGQDRARPRGARPGRRSGRPAGRRRRWRDGPPSLADSAPGSRPVRPPRTAGTPLDAADGSADVVVGLWSTFRAPSPDELADVDRVLRPDGRLLVVQDYGRDDVSRLRGELPEYGAWSRRDGLVPVRNGFRIRVIHCFWTFGSLDEARTFLGAAFGPAGEAVGRGLQRPRLTLQRGVYHRSRRGPDRRPDRAPLAPSPGRSGTPRA